MLPEIKQHSKTIEAKTKNTRNKSQTKKKSKGRNFVSDFKIGH